MEVKAKTLGIIGGMGPAATLDLFYKILKATPAKRDQDHIHIIIDDFPQIPDRTAFLLGKGENPLPYILKSVKTLEKANVDVLCMPCNTAHYFVEDIRKATPLPFISIIESTLNTIKRSFENSKNIGLLATDGTIIGRVYHNIFEVERYRIITPIEEKQHEVMKIVYSIKAGKMEENVQAFEEIIEHMKFLGSELVILGCTELPILLKYFEPSLPVIDATSCLAKEIANFATGR
ncbi:aspartate/glutamate racemase family protein [Candidatus Cryosericum septentrionale]|jgi:aspartate racemase|uniref:Aspartate/glutamate racemase family protein n=1 Tax=Candidatus Cryosericum septentrionale TaxID=2290913 RepID=A0A398DLH1_9BACT|nr:aspartate/glutamate racemase family protein [Candidatus Cryosericum septentrionale]